MDVANLGSQPWQVYTSQQLGAWSHVGSAAEVVGALSEGEDPLGHDLLSGAIKQILAALRPMHGSFTYQERHWGTQPGSSTASMWREQHRYASNRAGCPARQELVEGSCSRCLTSGSLI